MAISRMQQPRQMYQEGGIMPRLNQLGSGVSSAEQMLQGINQRLESAESSLGEGGGNTSPIGSGFMQPVSMNNPQAPDLRAIPEPMKDPSYQPKQSQLPFLGRPVEGMTSQISQLGSSPMSEAMRNMAADGGMMGRQMYGLGSLVKSIGKAAKGVVKGVKDVAKSPIGKAALLYTAGFGIPGTSFGGLLGSSAGSMFGARQGLFGTYGPVSALKNLGIMKSVGDAGMAATRTGPFAAIADKLSGNLFKAAAITIPSVLAAAGVEDEQEIAELQQDKGKLAVLLERGYRNLNPIGTRNPEEYEAEVQSFVRDNLAEGGRIGYAMGSPEENAIQASGIMGLPLNENPAGVTELDLRETGGFIPPVGVKEKADDIPAMLSNNEFVFTADAVRGMGGGDVDKGAERMYAMMKTLENGGRV